MVTVTDIHSNSNLYKKRDNDPDIRLPNEVSENKEFTSFRTGGYSS